MKEVATQVAPIAWQHSRGAGRGRGTRYSTKYAASAVCTNPEARTSFTLALSNSNTCTTLLAPCLLSIHLPAGPTLLMPQPLKQLSAARDHQGLLSFVHCAPSLSSFCYLKWTLSRLSPQETPQQAARHCCGECARGPWRLAIR